MKKVIIPALAAFALAGSAHAQSFSNGAVALSYKSFDLDNPTQTFSDTKFEGYAIFDVGSGFDIQVGGNYNYLEYQPDNTYNDYGYNIHVAYNFGGHSRVGAFYAFTTQWDYPPLDTTTFGLEYQYMTGPFTAEIQVGSTELYGSDSAIIVSASGSYAYGDFIFGASYSYLDVDYLTIGELALNASYQFANFYNTTLFAEYAYRTSDNIPYDDTSIRVGIEIPFGAGSKTPFSDPNEFIRASYIYMD